MHAILAVLMGLVIRACQAAVPHAGLLGIVCRLRRRTRLEHMQPVVEQDRIEFQNGTYACHVDLQKI